MYSFDSKVRYSECDEHGRLSLLSLINYLQDCSTFNSESINRGVGYMAGKNQAWLIAAWQIEIERLPRFYDDIRVSTWCHTMGRTLASRNFVVSDADGAQLVRADSLWFVFDFAKGRPVRITEDQHIYLTDEPPLDMPETSRRLPVEGPYVEAPPVVVSEMHLDTNRHVNNAQYIGMATNALAAIAGSEATDRIDDIERISVQYKNQALLGDTIVPRVHGDEHICTVDLTDQAGESFAVVRLELRDKSEAR
jgi:acyl-ACP thioesterase